MSLEQTLHEFEKNKSYVLLNYKMVKLTTNENRMFIVDVFSTVLEHPNFLTLNSLDPLRTYIETIKNYTIDNAVDVVSLVQNVVKASRYDENLYTILHSFVNSFYGL